MKRSPNLEPIPIFVEKYLDGIANEQDVAALANWLNASSDHVRQFAAIVFFSHAIKASVTKGQQRQEIEACQITGATESEESFASLLAELEPGDAAKIQLVDITEKLEREETERKAKQAEQAVRHAAAYEAQARRLGLADENSHVHKRLIIPSSIFYGGIAALVAVALWIGWSAVSSMRGDGDKQRDIAETVPEPPVPQPPVVITRPVVATLIRTLDAVWAERTVAVRQGEDHAAVPLTGGAELREGDSYTLLQGFAQLDTKRGAIVVLEAPCSIEFLDENEVKLSRGKLVGRCPTPPQPRSDHQHSKCSNRRSGHGVRRVTG